MLQNKKRTSSLQKQEVQKVEKVTFFQRAIGHFSTFFLLAIQARKMCCMIFQNEKRTYQAIKRRNLKSRKIGIFPKGLVPVFGPKVTLFPTFFEGKRGAIQARKMCCMIFQNNKKTFQAIKKTFKKSKNCIFPKGQPMVLVQNWPYFKFYSFKQYRPGTCIV